MGGGSARTSETGDAGLMLGYEYDAWGDKSDQYPAQPVQFAFKRYEHPEHMRWAAFFDFAEIRYSYRPEHFGLNIQLGLRPAFFLDGIGWFHCLRRKPGAKTAFGASSVAELSGWPFHIATEPMTPPGPGMPPSPPIYVTAGHGHAVWRFWGGRPPRANLHALSAHHDLREPRIAAAFSQAREARGVAVRA